MNVFEQMEAQKSSFTKTDNEIYALISKFPKEFSTNRINQLVSAWGISQSALTRFAKKLGFFGFAEFQYQYRLDLNEITARPQMSRSEYIGSLLHQIECAVSKKDLSEIAEKMISARTVYASGSSIAKIPAFYVSSSSAITGLFRAVHFNPDEFSVCCGSDDVMLIFSAYTGNAFQKQIESQSKKEDRPYTILITFNQCHSLIPFFDKTVILPAPSTAGDSSSAAGEPIAFLFFLDLLGQEIAGKKSV